MVVEKFTFQTEINQLLNLIINTFYSQKEVFIRELISNSSDAIDKYNHYCLINKPDEKIEAKIDIIPDKENNIIRFIDTGIGMTKQDLLDNIGTIAQSGTKKFMESVKDSKLIGSYGVGFFSSYIVSSTVSIVTKHPTDGFYRWSSDASGEFTIETLENGKITEDYTLIQGTCIECTLKEDCKIYNEVSKIKEIIKKHSQYINYPINIQIFREESKEVIDDSIDDDLESKPINDDNTKSSELDSVIIEDVEDTEPKPPKMKIITEKIKEFENINNNKPIWTKNASEVSDDEYKSFYKSLSNDNEDPYAWKIISGEGQVDYKGILYLPKKIKNNVFERGVKQTNIKLYVKKVFVTDDASSISPEWLHFISGLVDTDDLPLNISREMLQENKIVKILKKAIIKKSIDMLKNLMEDRDVYDPIYSIYQKNIKLGVYEESGDRERIADLVLYFSMNSPDKMISFDDYITNMDETQEQIYFITGDDMDIMKASPFLERFEKNKIDVLFMNDPVDEYMCQRLEKYKDKKLVCITKGNIELFNSPEEKESLEKAKEVYSEFCTYIKNLYINDFTEIKISNNFVDSPCIISSHENGLTANMERIVKAQTLGQKDSNLSNMMNKRILELNYKHLVIIKIQSIYKDKPTIAANLLDILINGALLYCGYTLPKPTEFSKKLIKIVTAGLDMDEDTGIFKDDIVEKSISKKEEINKPDNNEDMTSEIKKVSVKKSPLETSIETINISDMNNQD